MTLTVCQPVKRRPEELVLFVKLVYCAGLWTKMTDGDVQISAFYIQNDPVPNESVVRRREYVGVVQDQMDSGVL
jgi:hypothetical protein